MNEYTSQLEEKLQAQGFETFTDRDGMLGVRRGEKYLGSIGSHGEFYCNSVIHIHHPPGCVTQIIPYS